MGSFPVAIYGNWLVPVHLYLVFLGACTPISGISWCLFISFLSFSLSVHSPLVFLGACTLYIW